MSTILITGTSTGIGHATALELARAGHQVFATMRNPHKAPQLAETAAREGLDLTVLPLDVDSDASVEAAFSEVFALVDQLDVLINNAGIGQWYAIEDGDLSHFRQTMETNYFGIIRCLQAVLPHMRENRSGHIINVSSVSGRICGGAQSSYCASKWAVEALSEALAQEVYAYNIKVNIVEPGITKTPIMRNLHKVDPNSHYPHAERLKRLFEASLQRPVPPKVVAEKILEILNADTCQLRHPVGPDALPYLTWRTSMTDEEWVALGGQSTEEWEDMVRNGFGLPV